MSTIYLCSPICLYQSVLTLYQLRELTKALLDWLRLLALDMKLRLKKTQVERFGDTAQNFRQTQRKGTGTQESTHQKAEGACSVA